MEKEMSQYNVEKLSGKATIEKQPFKATIEKPPHYQKELDVFTILEHYPHLCFKRGSALKYLLRAGQKEGVTELEDLDKLTNCIERRKKEIRDKG